MLFSQPDVAAFLSDSFECVWESVRPVPRVTVDFGNGRVLERTLRGNIATYVCTGAGRTIDLIPGLVDGEEYTARLQQSLALFHDSRTSGAGPLGAFVAAWHSARVGASEDRPTESNFAKFAVEMPLERSLDAALGRIASPSKSDVESPLENALRSGQSGFDDSGLLRDTVFAREEGYRGAHQLLASRPLARPARLCREVYRELLHVDLEDPYLGLAPEVLGGEPGRF